MVKTDFGSLFIVNHVSQKNIDLYLYQNDEDTIIHLSDIPIDRLTTTLVESIRCRMFEEKDIRCGISTFGARIHVLVFEIIKNKKNEFEIEILKNFYQQKYKAENQSVISITKNGMILTIINNKKTEGKTIFVYSSENKSNFLVRAIDSNTIGGKKIIDLSLDEYTDDFGVTNSESQIELMIEDDQRLTQRMRLKTDYQFFISNISYKEQNLEIFPSDSFDKTNIVPLRDFFEPKAEAKIISLKINQNLFIFFYFILVVLVFLSVVEEQSKKHEEMEEKLRKESEAKNVKDLRISIFQKDHNKDDSMMDLMEFNQKSRNSSLFGDFRSKSVKQSVLNIRNKKRYKNAFSRDEG